MVILPYIWYMVIVPYIWYMVIVPYIWYMVIVPYVILFPVSGVFGRRRCIGIIFYFFNNLLRLYMVAL